MEVGGKAPRLQPSDLAVPVHLAHVIRSAWQVGQVAQLGSSARYLNYACSMVRKMTRGGLRRGSGGCPEGSRETPGRGPGVSRGFQEGSGSDPGAKIAPGSLPEPSWGPPGGSLGPSWGCFGPSCGRLSQSSGPLGRVLGRLGGDLGAKLGPSGRLGRVLGASWRRLGPS